MHMMRLALLFENLSILQAFGKNGFKTCFSNLRTLPLLLDFHGDRQPQIGKHVRKNRKFLKGQKGLVQPENRTNNTKVFSEEFKGIAQ